MLSLPALSLYVAVPAPLRTTLLLYVVEAAFNAIGLNSEKANEADTKVFERLNGVFEELRSDFGLSACPPPPSFLEECFSCFFLCIFNVLCF